MNRIGVGIIGGGVQGWAAISHVPALAALRDFELRAVSTSRRESAAAASEAFGVRAYDNHDDLVSDPAVDIVVVAVKVTHHAELTAAAIAAGKTVYTEWPLGVDLADAEELARHAAAAGVRTIIGLQGRFAPAVRYARDLIADGYVGDVLGTTLIGSGTSWGPTVARANAYWYDDRNGATTFTVPTLHALDAMQHVLGDLVEVSADLNRRRDQVTLIEDRSTLTVTAPDHVAINGVLAGGAAASIYYRGGTYRGDNLRWEINGTDGDLIMTSQNGNMQIADLDLFGGRAEAATVAPLAVPDSYYVDVPADLSGPAHNVAQLYAHYARDVAGDTHLVPDFAHALRRHRFIDAVNRSANTGVRQSIPVPGLSIATG